jgi:hypothetical protein
MIRPLSVLTVAILFGLSSGCQKVELSEFSPDGSFKVLMPEKKEEKSQSFGGVPGKVWSSEYNDGAFLVAVLDVPGGSAVGDALADIALKEGQQNAIKGVNGQLVSDSSIKLQDKYPGRQFEAKVKVPRKSGSGEIDGIIKCRIYFVKGKMYMIQAIGKPDWVAAAEIGKFLESLEILK